MPSDYCFKANLANCKTDPSSAVFCQLYISITAMYTTEISHGETILLGRLNCFLHINYYWILFILHKSVIITENVSSSWWSNKQYKNLCGSRKHRNWQTHAPVVIKVCIKENRGYHAIKQRSTLWSAPTVTFTSVENCGVARHYNGPDRSMARCPELCYSESQGSNCNSPSSC